MTDPWTREDNPFNFSATGYLGRKRPEMLTNHLLQRCRLGEQRQQTLNLPQNVVYGDTFRSPFTVADALTGWAKVAESHPKERYKHPRTRTPNDFLQSNMGSATYGLNTVEEVNAYRQTRKRIPMMFYASPEDKRTRPPPIKLDPTSLYGKKTTWCVVNLEVPAQNNQIFDDELFFRDKESMADLIAHVYHKQWYLNARRETKVEEAEKHNFKKIRSNLATKLRHIEISARTTKIPTQSRRIPQVLSSVKPHLSTFRSENARQLAWDAHEKKMVKGNPASTIDKKERLPHYQRIPPIKDFHLCPPQGPRPSE